MKFDTQLDRHCSKTLKSQRKLGQEFDYQLDRHCSKTRADERAKKHMFDYQLDRHCSKTIYYFIVHEKSLITS